MQGLHRLQNEFGRKTLFVVLSVLAFLFLAAFYAQPARADVDVVVGATSDQAADVVETADDATVAEANGAPGDEKGNPPPLEEIVEEVMPPMADEAIEALADIAPDVAPNVGNAIKVVEESPPVVEEVLDAIEVVPPVVEDLLTVIDFEPVPEVVEDPLVAIVEEPGPVVAEVAIMVPPHVVDMVRVLPLFVPAADADPAPIEVAIAPATAPASTTQATVLSSDNESRRSTSLFSKELLAEMTLFHLGDLTERATAGGSSASPVPERETAALAAYVPIAGTMPVVGGAGVSSSTGSSHSGSSFFGGLDAFSFFAAMAALLALCLVGWIRDHSRSGRSIFPTHGGRPG